MIVAHPVIGAEAGHRTINGPGEFARLRLLLTARLEPGQPCHDAERDGPLLAWWRTKASATPSSTAPVLYNACGTKAPLPEMAQGGPHDH